MKKAFIYCLTLLLVSSMNLSCRHRQVDPLDAVMGFKANDKYFKSTLKTLHFIIETQPIASVETIFNQTIEAYGLPLDPKGCADGVYIGETPQDAFDYRHVVRLEIKDGVIVNVDYDEIKNDGHGKKNNEEYNKEMSKSGTNPAIAYPQYEKQLLEKQNILEVDAISGATYSLYRFRLATTVALIKARLKAKN